MNKPRKTYNVKSPAKINTGLRVLSKRNDGFHNIETIFYPVKLFDEITVRIGQSAGGSSIIKVTSPGQKIKNEDNICYKAAKLFLKVFRIAGNYRIDIRLKKNIPAGAGLGGGSSDAASVLKILARHFRVKDSRKIFRVALALGSDVPFFLNGTTAYAEGRGEKLTPLPGFKIKDKILIVNPGIHISTPWAYKELKIKSRKLKTLNKVKKFYPENERLMINDFERVVFRKYPQIEKIKYDMLRLGAEFALMSGSGSTVYGIFTPQKAKAAERYFRGCGYKAFLC